MRLLLATDHYPPFIGGAHRQSELLAAGMARRGHRVSVVTVRHGGLPDLQRSGDVDVHRVRQLRTAFPRLMRDRGQRHQVPFVDPVSVRDIRRVIAKTRPDVIHAYGWLAFSVATALTGKQIPMLLSARDYGYFCATRTLLHRDATCDGPAPAKCIACASNYYGSVKGPVSVLGVRLSRRQLARKVSGLHSVSSFMENVTRRHLLGSARQVGDGALLSVVIPPFQDLAPDEGRQEEIKRELKLLPDGPFIMFVGAFRHVKGLEVLFDAYRRLTDPPRLVLIGTFERDTPPDFPPGTIVLRDAPHAAVMAAWDRALFGVMPSLWPEPFGSVVAEGMSRGKAVIGTYPGGHVDMLDSGCGILVPQGDVDALREAMESLILDPARRRAIGESARARARQFTADLVLPRYEQAYQDLLGRRDRSGIG